jgi:hypothetical protein
MKRNPMIMVGVIRKRSSGIEPELALVRLRALEGVCRNLMAPGLYRNQEYEGRKLIQRLLARGDKPLPLEIIIGVLLSSRLCGQNLDPKLRAIIVIAENGVEPQKYPVRILRDPLPCDFNDPDQVSAVVSDIEAACT